MQNRQNNPQIMNKNLIKSFLGLIIILFIFWTRFIRDRLKVSDIKISNYIFFDYLKNIFILLFITYFLILFLINIKIIFKINKESFITKSINNNFYVKNLKIIIQEYIIDAPNFLYLNLTKNLNIKPWIEKPASYFVTRLYYPVTLIFCFIVLPRIIIATLFVFCLLYFKTMLYFYYSLNLLIPLLFFKIYIYIVHQFSSRYLDTIETFIKFEKVTNDSGGGYILKIIPEEEYNDKSYDYESYTKQFATLCNLWHIYTFIYNSMIDFKEEEKIWLPYTQIYTSICFLIGWSYILFNCIK